MTGTPEASSDIMAMLADILAPVDAFTEADQEPDDRLKAAVAVRLYCRAAVLVAPAFDLMDRDAFAATADGRAEWVDQLRVRTEDELTRLGQPNLSHSVDQALEATPDPGYVDSVPDLRWFMGVMTIVDELLTPSEQN